MANFTCEFCIERLIGKETQNLAWCQWCLFVQTNDLQMEYIKLEVF